MKRNTCICSGKLKQFYEMCSLISYYLDDKTEVAKLVVLTILLVEIFITSADQYIRMIRIFDVVNQTKSK